MPHDTASRLTSEARTFNGVGGTYTLNYLYTQLGQLKEITDPWNVKVGYNYNHAGEVTGVTGQNYGGVTTYASGLVYRAFGGLKQMNYGNGRSLSLSYNNRMFLTQWNIPGVMGWNYAYQYFSEQSGRVTYAQNLNDATLDRSYDYDHVGRLTIAHTGIEARGHTGQGSWGTPDGPYSHHYGYDQWGNLNHRQGWGGIYGTYTQDSPAYTNNKRNGFTYDAAGNLTNDLGQTFTYDATGQQATASYGGYSLGQYYDGDRLRVKKVENGTPTYYLRSSVLGGQVVAEFNASGTRTRGYVYLGGDILAVQQNNQVSWMHQDPVAKSKRITDGSGNVVSTLELDPWGGETTRSSNSAFQPRHFTTYERDGNASDEAMHRRYNRWHSRFDQPDPYGGSYNMTNPQSFNRYAYVQNDPVNFVDPSGLDQEPPRLRPFDPSRPYDPNLEQPISGGDRGSIGGVSFGPMDIEAPPVDGPTGEGDFPQNPAPGFDRDLGEPPPNQPGCDLKLAALFGGEGAVADTGRTPSTLLHSSAGMQRFPDHSAEGGVMHLYTNAQGTAGTVGLYVPSGFSAVPGGSGVVRHPRSSRIRPGQVRYNYSQYRNSAGITISFIHIGPPAGPVTNSAGSRRVGSIAGPGGEGAGYNHTHINFYSDFATRTRVDPRTLFCREFGF